MSGKQNHERKVALPTFVQNGNTFGSAPVQASAEGWTRFLPKTYILVIEAHHFVAEIFLQLICPKFKRLIPMIKKIYWVAGNIAGNGHNGGVVWMYNSYFSWIHAEVSTGTFMKT
jgi:hypothetical protein